MLKNLLVSILGGFVALMIYVYYFENQNYIVIRENGQTVQTVGNYLNTELPSFRASVKKSIDAVVHIRTQYETPASTLYDVLFSDKLPFPLQAEGSGVIISEDGYIVTNFHVIEKASQIQVIMTDKRTFRAKIIGLDPTTDLALLKIQSHGLPFAEFGNSDDLEVGDWVLAIGNPYSLGSTVTAGIISAKSRSINIIDKRSAVEAFLQTDAAVNPGNSGGALVDTEGRLVGINTAIASQTGSYIGYSFAVPINIVRKVSADLREFGKVQRAILGVKIDEIDAKFAKELGIKKIEGVFISDVDRKGAADRAGLQIKDILVAFENVNLNSPNELYEQLARHRPGDVVSLKVKRGDTLIEVNVTLANYQGKTNEETNLQRLGAEYKELTTEEKQKLRIECGLKVSALSAGKLLNANVKEGFIILTLNKVEINSVVELEKALIASESTVFIEGIYPDGKKAYYAFTL